MAKQPCPEKEAHWRGVLRRHSDSGLSIAEFCRSESILVSSFYQWRRVIRDRDQKVTVKSSPPRIVPVTLTQESLPAETNERFELSIRIPGRIEVIISQSDRSGERR